MLKIIMTAIVVAVMAMTQFQGTAQAGQEIRVAQGPDVSEILDLVESFSGRDDDDDDDAIDYDDCQWLKAKARRTDSRYWWKRYRRCRDYND